MQFDLFFMWTAALSGLRHLPTTLVLTASAFGIGLVLGTLIAVLQLFRVRFWSRFFHILVTVLKAVPMVLVQYLVYFLFTDAFNALAEALHWTVRSKDFSLVGIGAAALSVVAVTTISQTVRGAFAAVPQGQYEAAYAAGLTRWQTVRRIILPQMLPVALPNLCSNLIVLLKSSSLVYLISVTDLLNGTLLAATSNYAYLEAYVAAALLYWGLCILIEAVFHLLERQIAAHRTAVQ